MSYILYSLTKAALTQTLKYLILSGKYYELIIKACPSDEEEKACALEVHQISIKALFTHKRSKSILDCNSKYCATSGTLLLKLP